MRIVLNGAEHDLPEVATVADVVAELVDRPERGVAVALDGEVVPRSAWSETKLAHGAAVEVLRAVQGG
ncbi:MAG: sulfur carrier protein ThiS [Gaiellaceae bacterium]